MDLSFLAPEGSFKEVYKEGSPVGFTYFSIAMLVLELPLPQQALPFPAIRLHSLIMPPGIILSMHYLDGILKKGATFRRTMG